MGIMQPYFPTEMAIKLAKIAKANIFIETGTYMGGTTKWASTQFTKVHTIELSELLYNQIKDELLQKGNIIPHFGDSRDILADILANTNDNIIFWLDGHYSGSVTAGKDNPCPLLKELEIILTRNNDDIIIIDDARCLTGKDGWPTIFEINKKLDSVINNTRYMIICDDNIYIIPNNNIYKEPLLNYVLQRNIFLWNNDYNIRSQRIKKRNEIKEKIIKILKLFRLYKFTRMIYRLTKVPRLEKAQRYGIFAILCPTPKSAGNVPLGKM